MKSLRAIDLFAGLGGFTEGAEQAGIKVVWAANHWKAAVQVHANNHPITNHEVQDLRQADFTKLPNFNLMLASPCCQGHSNARGKDRPHHDSARATAYAVFEAACAKLPDFIVVENVREFRNWGTKEKKGIFYQRWLDNFEDLGYTSWENLLQASEFGVPQERLRLFITMVHQRVSTDPIIVRSPKRQGAAAKDILQWDAKHEWKRTNTLCANTCEQIRVGRVLHGNKFLVEYYGQSYKGRSLNRPLGTVTTKDRYGLVDGQWFRMLTVTEYRRAMGFRDTYQLPTKHSLALKMLGNAVCPAVAQGIINTIRKVA